MIEVEVDTSTEIVNWRLDFIETHYPDAAAAICRTVRALVVERDESNSLLGAAIDRMVDMSNQHEENRKRLFGRIVELEVALRDALSYVESAEAEVGVTLSTGDKVREVLSKSEAL